MYWAVSFLIRRSAWCITFSLQICLSTPLEVWSTSSDTGFDGADRALLIRSMVWITELQVLIYVKIILFTANVPGTWPQLTQDTVRPNRSHCLKPWPRVRIALPRWERIAHYWQCFSTMNQSFNHRDLPVHVSGTSLKISDFQKFSTVLNIDFISNVFTCTTYNI